MVVYLSAFGGESAAFHVLYCLLLAANRRKKDTQTLLGSRQRCQVMTIPLLGGWVHSVRSTNLPASTLKLRWLFGISQQFLFENLGEQAVREKY
jgi:hypothetical protein